MASKAPRILVADNDSATRHDWQQHFEDAGYPVCTVSNADDALLLCEIDPPDLVVMDVHLPDLDGFEACERIRHETRGRDMTIIIVTEVSDDMTRSYLGQMVEYAGGDYFIAKPCDGHVLVQLVDNVASHAKRPVSA